jgi:hypothetical protein
VPEATGDITAGKLLLVEYERIKEEQKTRIGFRDNLVYATLASMAAVIAATLNSGGHTNLLLLLPPVSVVLGWTYLVNDEKVSAAGRYIRNEIAPRLETIAGAELPVFGWETAHRMDSRRQVRKVLQLAVDLATFSVAPLAAVVIFWVYGPSTAPFVIVSLVEVAAVAVLGMQIVLYAELSRRER